ncbi:metallophosphoesterase [Ornithinibacillus halotolerans]|uniref:Metallophosphoesterase YkoQ n=1 Tax=Ornithinibacillus halotolerans TaxID=1274357 RepID=A0A916RRW6_9BACI|nr:metallophosphoesterase [Ornithinibacillus halotolerans]GGA67292.1 putative metallophosphoesterase YkoQ [Ornithinibacillus halotolerans]
MAYIISATLFIIISYFIYKANKNTKDVKINNIQVPTKHQSSQSTLSILHLSDLHLENISISPRELAIKLSQEKPDLIALTGDFLDRKRTIPKLIPYLKVIQELQPTYGTYAVLGNHDYVLKGENLTNLISTLEQYNVVVMQNSNKTIEVNNQIINIIGIDDYSTNRSNLEKSYEQIKIGINIVLTHDPNIVLQMDNYHFDYLLAGHFHGGQIRYPKAYHLVKMGQLPRLNIVKGLHTHNDSPFYISEGLGQTGVNIRVGSRPEITYHNLAI